jgi:hypothetical protein
MEQHWSARDDAPYLRSPGNSYAWLVWLLAAALVASFGIYYYLGLPGPTPSLTAPTPVAPKAEAPQDAPAPEAPRRLLAMPEAPPAESLPTLDNSDSLLRRSLSGLMGQKAFDETVVPTQLVRKIVATVDNLPRATTPRRIVPLNPVPGAFVTGQAEEALRIDAANFVRYVPYVRVMEAVSAKALVFSYVQAYPLFQRAYEELGYPGKYFNDRLVEAIDDLLAAPELDGPIALIRPKVLFEFADPELETRSAGQKIMLRMGPDNAARVKEKLREIRREILAASERAPR